MACARVPMIKHLDGVCHVYIDDAADLEKARAICDNAKTQRFGVCNAMETLLVARGIAAAALPLVCQTLRNKNVELRACPQSDAILENAGVGRARLRLKQTGALNIWRPSCRFASWTDSTQRLNTLIPTAPHIPMRLSRSGTRMPCGSCAKWILRA